MEKIAIFISAPSRYLLSGMFCRCCYFFALHTRKKKKQAFEAGNARMQSLGGHYFAIQLYSIIQLCVRVYFVYNVCLKSLSR